MAEVRQHCARALTVTAIIVRSAVGSLDCLGLAITLLTSAVAVAQPREVLVFLGNGSSPTQTERNNVLQIAGWLKSSSIPDEQLLGDAVIEDLTSFSAQVDSDVEVIGKHLEVLSGVVLATNRLLQSGGVLVGGGGTSLKRVPITVATPRDGREESSPLSNPYNVGQVLRIAASAFDPGDHEFVVVVESHGDDVYALTPRLGLPTAGLTREALLSRVRGSDNVFVERYGITTGALLQLLAARRRTDGFRTSLLVLQSCRSTIDELPPEVPTALVAANGEPLPYGVIDYEKVLTSAQPTLREAFITTLTPTPFEIADPALVFRRRARAKAAEWLRIASYFGPLALWGVVYAWVRRARARQLDLQR